MNRRVIIPAAGQALRFGGCPKELLPIDINECCLTRAVRMGKQMGEVVVITNQEKQVLHERVLSSRELIQDCRFIRQGPAHKELWGAVKLGLERNRAGGLILADTVTSICALPMGPAKIQFGVFETQTPERFSVVQNAVGGKSGQMVIRTKEHLSGRQLAWGLVMWDAVVTNFFLDNSLAFDHYDRAFEAAAMHFGGETFQLSYYYDLGTFPSYLEFLSITHWQNQNYGKAH